MHEELRNVTLQHTHEILSGNADSESECSNQDNTIRTCVAEAHDKYQAKSVVNNTDYITDHDDVLATLELKALLASTST